MAYQTIRVETPKNGPLDLLVYHDASIWVRDCAGPLNAPEAPEFVVNRVPLSVALDFEPDAAGAYAWAGYPKGGRVGKRHSVAYDDSPSYKTQEKAREIALAAIAEHRAEIDALMPKLRAHAAAEAYERACKDVDKARAALAVAQDAADEAQKAFSAAVRALPR